jgi:alkaline phosphatase
MKNVFLRRKNILISVILILCLILSTLSFAQQDINDNENRVKNVILMIPDGMTIAHTTLARWYQDGKPLAMDELACGLVRTYSANNPITDSAPAATAYATGYKTQRSVTTWQKFLVLTLEALMKMHISQTLT